jgi:ATP-dependent Clp protease protease subunit
MPQPLENLTKEHFIWGNLLENRTLTLFSGVDSTVAKDVIEALLFLDNQDSSKPITLYINSPGGEVNSGFAIYDTMRFIKSEVKVVCSGLCASIATIILIGAKKENRLSLPNSRFLIHQPLLRGGVQGQATDIQIHSEQILKTRQKINELLAKECGQSLEKVSQDTERDYWMDANESLKYGLITKIINAKTEL